jgi:hypothetical protein
MGKGQVPPRWDATRTVLHDKRRPGEAPTHAIDALSTSQPSCAKPERISGLVSARSLASTCQDQLLHEPLCAYCLQRGLVVPAEIADHVERHVTGTLQSLCRSCHSSAKAREERRGFRVNIGEDGWPVAKTIGIVRVSRWTATVVAVPLSG